MRGPVRACSGEMTPKQVDDRVGIIGVDPMAAGHGVNKDAVMCGDALQVLERIRA